MLRIPPHLPVPLRLQRVSWLSTLLRSFLLACVESSTAQTCFSPLSKSALVGSALVKAGEHVRAFPSPFGGFG